MKRKPEDVPAPFLPEMLFWVDLDAELVGARSENGFLRPSEIFFALDRWGIKDESNRATAKRMLDACAIGRNQASNEILKE